MSFAMDPEASPPDPVTPSSEEAPLPKSLKLGWAVGGAGSTTILYIVNGYFLFFMVAHLGIPPAVAGGLMLLARVFDAAADLSVGMLSDRTRSRWGRRRPWMAGGTVLCTLGMASLFLPPLAPAILAPKLQTLIVLVVVFVGYSSFSIPSSAMPAEMTTSYQGRTSLMAYRTFFIQVAGLAGTAVAPALVAWGRGTTGAYIRMGFIVAAFVALTMGATVVMTASARETQRTQHNLPRLQWIASLFGNRPFMILMGVKFCGYVATAAFGAAALFFMRDILNRGEAGMAQLGLISAVAGMASVPLWRALVHLAPKERVYIGGLILTGVASASWLMAAPTEPDWLFFLRSACLGVAASGTVLMSLSILPDAIEHDFHRTGLRREGVYSAMFEFFQKAAYAVGPFLVGLFLQANGYHASTGAVIRQSGPAREAVRLTMGVLPCIAYAIAILLLLSYRLPRRGSAI